MDIEKPLSHSNSGSNTWKITDNMHTVSKRTTRRLPHTLETYVRQGKMFIFFLVEICEVGAFSSYCDTTDESWNSRTRGGHC
jgi:hypothetical protein